jgi:2-amino-1-hydroxyethylphosphonate dioxygenase (glycine-forming)
MTYSLDPNRANQILSEIEGIFKKIGENAYFGEPVSQFEHAAQTIQLAIEQNYDTEVQVAAFLHDIGHMLHSLDGEMGSFGNKNHEQIAACWLRERRFSDKIINLIENHVAAKRYLTAVDYEYHTGLSEASKITLIHQGGPMTETEIELFEQLPYFREIIRLRRWDDAAKQINHPIKSLEFYLNICKNYLSHKWA